MNILFLTLLKIDTLQARGIYHDLMREFVAHQHNIYIISPTERREKNASSLSSEQNAHFLNVKTLNIQKTNSVEKGLATLSIEYLYLYALKKYFKNVKFDLVLYSTPPITFSKVIQYVKLRDGAKSYLLLKDIFPQNAVDMKLMSKNGLIYKVFRAKEKKLYEVSDFIGCMSEANRQYVLAHNPTVNPLKVEVNPNSIAPIPYVSLSEEEKTLIKEKYKLPLNRKIFIYGGNLGIPQGLDFLLQTIEATKNDPRIYFLIVGSGTEFTRIQNWFKGNKPQNAQLLFGVPKIEYDRLVKSCDIGMIFLHKDFTIPNFPSRLLSYLEAKLPVLVAADGNTDVGTEVEKNQCGKYVLAEDAAQMKKALDYFCDLTAGESLTLGENCSTYLEENFLVSQSYEKIINKLK